MGGKNPGGHYLRKCCSQFSGFSEDYQPVMLGSRALMFCSCSLKALNWHESGRFVMFSGPIQFEELEFPQSLVEKAEKKEDFFRYRYVHTF